MAENVHEIFWMLDASNYEVLYVSRAFETICGLPCQSLYDAPTSYREIIHPDDRAHVLDRLEQLPKTGTFDEEFRIVRPDSVVRWVRSIGFLAPDSSGKVTRLVGTVQDITERRTAQELLRDSEERYRDLVENSEDLICTHDLDGRLLFVNEAPARILGYQPDELKKRPMREFLPPRFHDQFDEYLARIQRDGFADGLLAVRTRSGETRIWRYKNTLRTVGVSKPIVRGIAHDITDLKRVERALTLSEEKFSKAFHASPIPLAISTAGEGCLLDVNESFVRQSGYSRDELIGHTDLELAVWIDPSQRERAVAEVLERGQVRNFEAKFRAKSGEVLDVRYCLERIVLGGTTCVLTTAEDITERRALEEQVRLSQKLDAVALLASGISHDFNNLLTGMLGYGELLLMGSNLGDRERRKVEAIVEAAIQARSITQQLLAFGRRQPLQPAAVKLNTVVADLSDFLRGMLGRNVKFATDLQPGLGEVRIDPTQLIQVIVNLVANSRDAMPQGGSLTVKTSTLSVAEPDAQLPGIKSGNYAVLAISDTGCGMDEKTQARIFEPFFTTKPEGRGTGLGLASVHGIIEQSGGHVRVSSRVGEGTTFRVYLPNTPGADMEREVPQAARKAAPNCATVLLVEDHDLGRKLASEFLRGHGYEVLAAKHGREAIQIARNHRGAIHLLLTDVVMPKMSGPVVAKRVVAIHPETKVLYMTAYSHLMDFGEDGLREHCEVLKKPFMHHELMSTVRHVLGETLTH